MDLRPQRLTVGGLHLEALSVGGIETCYQIPAFDACLDIGRCPHDAIRQRNLLLTHAHIDHAAGLPYYISMRGMTGQPPPRVYAPARSHEALAEILALWSRLQADTERCTFTALSAGDEVPLKGGYARAFASPHRIDTLGYTLFQRVRKLKPELVGVEGAEIARRVQAGEEVHQIIDRAELCFPGDTKIEVV